MNRCRHLVLVWHSHPGVGPITALAFVLILGIPEPFGCGKQVGSYLGLIPCEESSGGRQRLGHISQQGNTLLRFLLIESAHAVVRYDPGWRRQFLHLALPRGRPRTNDVLISASRDTMGRVRS